MFSPSPTGVLYPVSAGGGVPSPATVKAVADGVEVHCFPCFLPDGRHFRYVVSNAGGQRFLLNTMVDESGGAPLAVVVNWMAGLKR